MHKRYINPQSEIVQICFQTRERRSRWRGGEGAKARRTTPSRKGARSGERGAVPSGRVPESPPSRTSSRRRHLQASAASASVASPRPARPSRVRPSGGLVRRRARPVRPPSTTSAYAPAWRRTRSQGAAPGRRATHALDRCSMTPSTPGPPPPRAPPPPASRQSDGVSSVRAQPPFRRFAAAPPSLLGCQPQLSHLSVWVFLSVAILQSDSPVSVRSQTNFGNISSVFF